MKRLFKKKKDVFDGNGLVLFRTTAEAMRAEKVLHKAGVSAKLVAPPLSRRVGCDLAIEVNLTERLVVEKLINENGLSHEGFEVLSSESARTLEIVQPTRLGGFMMVRAGNMKETFDMKTGVISNISGGGCPDIPYLYLELVGKKLSDAPRPRELGSTLCALLLDRAHDECIRIMKEDGDAAHSRNRTG
jgi:hypothetical protein